MPIYHQAQIEKQHSYKQQWEVPPGSILVPPNFCHLLKCCKLKKWTFQRLSCAAFRLLINNFLPITQKPPPVPASKSLETYLQLAQLHRLLSLQQQGGIRAEQAKIEGGGSKKRTCQKLGDMKLFT